MEPLTNAAKRCFFGACYREAHPVNPARSVSKATFRPPGVSKATLLTLPEGHFPAAVRRVIHSLAIRSVNDSLTVRTVTCIRDGRARSLEWTGGAEGTRPSKPTPIRVRKASGRECL